MMQPGVSLTLTWWVVAVALLPGSAVLAQDENEGGTLVVDCPSRCQCFRTTVRCMFLQMSEFPVVPRGTTILDLRFNHIQEIPSGVFQNMQLEQLDTLLLNNNNIRTLRKGSFDGLPNLRHLYLYKNMIETIHTEAFHGLEKLEQLYIHFNELGRLQSNTFDKLPLLQRLFLHHNRIERLPPNIFSNLRSLRRLRLDSNALICDCEMMWLSQMLLDNEGFTEAAVTCSAPSSVEGKSLTSISADEMHCRKPEITVEPQDVEVTFGNTVWLLCSAVGDPIPEISWRHNDQDIETNSLEGGRRYQLLDDGTLKIEDIQQEDQGVYECVARNVAGEASTSAFVLRRRNSDGLDVVDSHEDEITVPTARPALVTRTVPNRQHAEAARPTIRHPIHSRPQFASNRALPQILIPPEDATLLVGETMELQCVAEGIPSPSISWTRNDLPLPDDFRYRVLPTGSLTVTTVRLDDFGIFRCIASSREGQVSAFARVQILEPPRFTQNPRNRRIVQGHSAFFTCDATGEPVPTISWRKDGGSLPSDVRFAVNPSGTTLSIRRVERIDQGTYTCVASSRAGDNTSSATLIVILQAPPQLVTGPADADASLGNSVSLRCEFNGDPPPTVRWLKDSTPVPLTTSEKYEVRPEGLLMVRNLGRSDEGRYECVAENIAGSARAYARLRVWDDRFSGIDDDFINRTVIESSNRVGQAVNNTIRDLRDPHRTRTPHDLLRLARYPSPDAAEISRAAEVFEQSLEKIFDEVHGGVQFANISHNGVPYQELLTPGQLAIISHLAGCEEHRRIVNCDDMCYHHNYRTMDGTCNNLQHPMQGASLSALNRLLPPRYENGFSTPLGWDQDKLHNGYRLKSARRLSLQFASTEHITDDARYTHMLMQWGQFLDHDLDFVPVAASNARFSDGRFCNETCDAQSPCFPIAVADDDPRIHRHQCIGFARSSAMCGTGATSVLFRKVTHRNQLNSITSYIDASNVYGSSDLDSRNLRDFTSNRGRLRTGLLMASGKALLPPNLGELVDCQMDFNTAHIPCFQSGDHRNNEQLGLLSMHTLWMREHNRVVDDLFHYNPHWDGDMLYHETRKIIGAMHQHITYKFWLPKILGPTGMRMLGEYKGYDPSVDASIINAFAGAAFRFGHSLVQPMIHRLNESFQPIPEGNLPLHKAFFAPFRIVEEGGIDPIFRGLFAVAAKKLTTGELLNTELTEKLFKLAHEVALDLAALNIQRGRDHGLGSYNDYREFCGIGRATTFDHLQNTISSEATRRRLREEYGHVDNIELWLGGLNEDIVEGSRLGPTFMCIIAEQFKRLRDGDRFYYENPGVFKPAQLAEIRQASLARVICDNSDNILQVQKDVFLLVDENDGYLDCEHSQIPHINLRVWSHCCHDCSRSGDFGSITSHILRSRRSTDYSLNDRKLEDEKKSALMHSFADGHATYSANHTSITHNLPDLSSESIDYNNLQGHSSEAWSNPRKSSMMADMSNTDAPITGDNMLDKMMDMAHQVMDDVDVRVEGMENVVSNLHKTIRKLNKKLRVMERKMSSMTGDEPILGCTDTRGATRSIGDKWKESECDTCVCKSEGKVCTSELCPVPTCEAPVSTPGICCPMCP